jgi:hypothetical protein
MNKILGWQALLHPLNRNLAWRGGKFIRNF